MASCSVLRKIKNGTSIHIWREDTMNEIDFKCFYKKYLSGVIGACVIYRLELQQLSFHILSRKFSYFSAYLGETML